LRARVAVILAGLAALVSASLFLDAAPLRDALLYAAEHPLGLLAAFGAYTAAFVLRAFAWRPFVPRRVPSSRLFALLLAALFLNHVAPAKAGDFARMYGLGKQGVEGGRAAASVILARLADLVGLLVVLAGAWALAGGARWGALISPAVAAAVISHSTKFLYAFAVAPFAVREGISVVTRSNSGKVQTDEAGLEV
jgi:hypothetical protein